VTDVFVYLCREALTIIVRIMDFLSSDFLLKFVKFGCVGLSGVLVDYGFTYLFKEIVKIHKYIANAIGFTLAATSNYFLNRIWTFSSHDPQIGIEYLKFFIISAIGLGINTLILYLLVSKWKKKFYVSKFFAILVVTIWNFFMNWLFTFTYPS
jgi:putative flippase GtrA